MVTLDKSIIDARLLGLLSGVLLYVLNLLTWGFECSYMINIFLSVKMIHITIYTKSENNLRCVVLFIIEHPLHIIHTMLTQKVTKANPIRNFTDIKIEYGTLSTAKIEHEAR